MDYSNYDFFKEKVEKILTSLSSLKEYYESNNTKEDIICSQETKSIKDIISKQSISNYDFDIYNKIKIRVINTLYPECNANSNENNILFSIINEIADTNDSASIEKAFFNNFQMEEMVGMLDEIDHLFDKLGGYEIVYALYNAYNNEFNSLYDILETRRSEKRTDESEIRNDLITYTDKFIRDELLKDIIGDDNGKNLVNDFLQKERNIIDNATNYNIIEAYPYSKSHIINTLLSSKDDNIVKECFDENDIRSLNIKKYNENNKEMYYSSQIKEIIEHPITDYLDSITKNRNNNENNHKRTKSILNNTLERNISDKNKENNCNNLININNNKNLSEADFLGGESNTINIRDNNNIDNLNNQRNEDNNIKINDRDNDFSREKSNNTHNTKQSKMEREKKVKPKQTKDNAKPVDKNIEERIEDDLENEIMGYAKSMKNIAKNFGDMITKDNIKLKEVEKLQSTNTDSTKNEVKSLNKFNSNDKVSFWLQIKMLAFVLISFMITMMIGRIIPRFI